MFSHFQAVIICVRILFCRFGHGCFLHCLETLYKKITGYELKYTALVGKPSEITYHYAERVLQREAARMNLLRLRRMYCIGSVFVIRWFFVVAFSNSVHIWCIVWCIDDTQDSYELTSVASYLSPQIVVSSCLFRTRNTIVQ